MRRTKIICTIGPASDSVERLRELMLAGMNVARFNFSHGDHEEQKARFEQLNSVIDELGIHNAAFQEDQKSTPQNTSHEPLSRIPSSA